MELVSTVRAVPTAEKVVAPVKAFTEVPVWVYDPSFVMPVMLVKAPVVEISQSEVLMAPVAELLPKVKRPEMDAVPTSRVLVN